MYKCEKCNEKHNGEYGSGRFCSSQCARSFSTQKKRKEINEKVSKKLKGKTTSNKIKRKCKKCGVPISHRSKGHCRKCYTTTDEYRKTMSKNGGIRKNSGHSKSGYYKGIWCHSTYELSFLIYHKDKKSNIKRCKKVFEYEDNGNIHLYYPDFEIDDIIYEIKGYHIDIVDKKLKSVIDKGYNIQILYKKDLEHIFSYVCEKHNIAKDLIYTLYDNNKPMFTYVCDYCKIEFKTERERKEEKRKFCSRVCSGKYNQKYTNRKKTKYETGI